MNSIKFSDYDLACPICGKHHVDDGKITTCLQCSRNGPPPLLEFSPQVVPIIDTTQTGVQRYSRFFPLKQLDCVEKKLTTTWKSGGFAASHGLSNLFFTATGYAPEKDIYSACCSFKDLEALTVINRLKSYGATLPLLLASAGNTARAFAYYGAKLEYPVILVTPSASRRYLWLPDEPGLHEKTKRFVKTVFVDAPGKYLHASLLCKNIAQALAGQVLPEGGYFNIGRTCGLGSCALNFYDIVGRFPEHYVQAVGSGAGVIGVIRSYELLKKYSTKKMDFHLVQNSPYTPLAQAIENKESVVSSEMYPNIDTVCSPMLTSADPAYTYPGALRQSMEEGIVLHGYGVTNQEIYDTQYELWRTEHVNVLLPAAAAVAGLLKAVSDGKIGPDQCIQVNLTGIGSVACMADHGYFYLPSAVDNHVQEVVCYGGAACTQWIDQNKRSLL